MSTNGQLSAAVERIRFARGLTKTYLDDLAVEDWFWMPSEGVTHIAWQVAHLAFAQYALLLRRIRGERPEDAQIISADFIERFGRGSTPVAGTENNPTVEEILRTFDRVHTQAVEELSQYSDEQLDVPSEPAHPAFTTNLGAVGFASQHELLHAGQIVLLRRLMGKKPKR